MKIPISILLTLLLLVTNLQFVGAEGIPNWRNDTMTPTAEKVLEAPNAYEQEAENGFRLYKSLAGQGGPGAFAVIGEDDFLILEGWMRYIKRFQGGQHVATIPLDAEDHLSDGGHMVANGRYAYVASYKELIQIDLKDYSQTRYTYPNEDIGYYTYDLLFDGNELILETEAIGNYRFDPANGSFAKTELGIHREPIQAGEHEMLRIAYGSQEWYLDACGVGQEVIGIDLAGNLYMSVFEWDLDRTDSGYNTIRKYDVSGKLIASTSVHRSNWFSSPWNEIRLGEDGRIYVMAVYEPFTAIYRLENSLTAAVYDPYVPIREEALEVRPVEPREGDEINAPWDNFILPMDTNRTRAQVQASAIKMREQKWTFQAHSGNNWRSEYDSVLKKEIYSRPAYLAEAYPGKEYTGIPYCWNGMNGNVGETLWPFIDCVGQTKNTTGNCTTTVIGDCIGIDCSGFVSAAYGLANKVNTLRFLGGQELINALIQEGYSDAKARAEAQKAEEYFPKIGFNDLQPMDMIVKDGHMMLFLAWEVRGRSLYTIESKAENKNLDSNDCVLYDEQDGKVITRLLTKEWLTGNQYSTFRRPAHWFTSTTCQHSHSYQQSTSSQHKVVCSKCKAQIRTENHQFSVKSTTASTHTRRCSMCGYSRTDSHSFRYSNITKTGHTKTCSLCGKQIREGHTASSGSGDCTQCGYTSPYTPWAVPSDTEEE